MKRILLFFLFIVYIHFYNISYCAGVLWYEVYTTQPPIEIVVSHESLDQDQEVCVDFRVKSFNNIESLQFAVDWDHSVLDYSRTGMYLDDIGINASKFLFQDTDQTLRFAWDTPSPVTVLDNSILFQVCFDIAVDCSLMPSSPVNIINANDFSVEAFNADGMNVEVLTSSGSVSLCNATCGSNLCNEANILRPQTPITCEQGEIVNTLESCLGDATSELIHTNCQHGEGPTVWYQLEIESLQATQLITSIEASGFDAVWSIYQGTTCQDMDTLIMQQIENESTVNYSCSSDIGGEGNNYITSIARDPDQPDQNYLYWIAITALGEVTDSSFILTYSSSLGCLACSGENAFDCDNGEFTATVDGEEWDPDGDGVAGPFCPGQEVRVCWDFVYDTTGSGNDWLHGMIPSFGSGWDMQSIDFASQQLEGSWQWYAQDDPNCPPVLSSYALPNICTYMEDGVLKLCNVTCNNCPCENGPPLAAGSPLPGAWFWSTSACDTLANCPIDQYGMSGGTNVPINTCVTLRVKTFDTDEECAINRDLKVIVQTTSDAVTGCWDDPSPCLLDPSISSPAWVVDCATNARVIGSGQTICSGGILDVDLDIEDGDIVEVVVEPLHNPSVEGESMNTFSAGDNPVINDVLINNSDVLQEVLYEVYTVDPTKPCPGVKDTVFVYVEPQIEIEFPVQEVCEGYETTLDVMETGITTGGTGNYVDFVWSPSLETTPSITVMPPVTTQYCVTVTDDFGCTGSTCTEVFVSSLAEIALVPTMDIVCRDGVEDLSLKIEANVNNGTAPFDLDWDIPPGLDYSIEDGDYPASIIVINEETSDVGLFLIDLTIIDAQNCEGNSAVEIGVMECDTLDCDFSLTQDSITIAPGDSYYINLLDNDMVPDSFSAQLVSIPELLQNVSFVESGDLQFEISDNFFEPLELIYEVCTADCECKQMSLFIIDEELEDIVPTNVFTPNGDGNNDQLRFTTSDVIPESEIWIYNRWGDCIFHMNGYNNSWTAEGYPAGIYYYVLDVGGNILQKTLTIVR